MLRTLPLISSDETTCKCETSDRNVFGGRIELDGRGDRRCGDPRDREYCVLDGGLEPKNHKNIFKIFKGSLTSYICD